MARQAGEFLENKFIKGLITEKNVLNADPSSSTDTYNCVFNFDGTLTRRPALDFEQSYVEKTITLVAGDSFTEYVWYTSAASNNQAFLVQQQGKTLHFFNITSSTTPSANAFATSIDLSTYLPSGSSDDPAAYRCQFTTGNGDLIVTNQVCNPFYVVWDETTQDISATVITLKYRDTVGLDDGLGLTTRPTKSVATLITDEPEHYYNIINQGWWTGDALSQWDTARTDMPSNADVVAYYRGSATDAFDNSRVTSYGGTSSAAPKGHFILNVGEDDRNGALVAEGFTSISITGGTQIIGRTLGTAIGDPTSNIAAWYDGTTSQSTSAATVKSSSTSMYLGKNYTSLGGFKCSGATVWASTSGFVSVTSPSITLTLYGKATAPANSSDGTVLGTSTFTDSNSKIVFLSSSDTTTSYNYLWVKVARADAAAEVLYVAEIRMYTPGATGNRPRCVAFYASRVWYAGVDAASTGSNLYFSQTTEDRTKYGLCYQVNDPTAEFLSDLLATDGGVIKIPDMGRVQAMFPFQSQLLIFASNGVWLISGGSGTFAATDFRVRRITNIGMNSPQSICDVKGVPVWWAEDGLYTVTYDANYDSTVAKSLTMETIKTFITTVPSVNRPYIKAAYDRINDICYWLFRSTAGTTSTELNTFNRILCLNARTGAFYPWSFDNTTSNVPSIRGISYIQDGDRAATYMIKMTVNYTRSATERLVYADFADVTNWKDWKQYSTLISSASNLIDYSSYAITGYRIDGKAIRPFQMNYLYTFMRNETGAGAYVQALYDFTNSSSSGKWSTPQSVYNSLTTKGRAYDDVRISRKLIRGVGKGAQIKYYSLTGQPFSIIGWGVFGTANQNI